MFIPNVSLNQNLTTTTINTYQLSMRTITAFTTDMNYTKWLIKYAGKARTTGRSFKGEIKVKAMSANHAITEAMVEIPNTLSRVQITTVQQLE